MRKIILSTFLLLPLGAHLAHAEKADSQQPLRIWSESQTYDGNKKVTVYTGSVRMVKGTMIINAARLEVVEDVKGGKTGTLFSGQDKLVTYRQKRDGGPDLWAEGEADKIVYDDSMELIKLFNQAKLVLLDGKKRTHESSGTFISYDSRTDFMSVNNTVDGVSAPGAGFTNAVIYPADEKPKAEKTTSVKPATKSDAPGNPSSSTKKMTPTEFHESLHE